MLIPLAIVIVVVAVFLLSRRPLTRRGPSGSESPVPSKLSADLERWVAAGLVEPHQAEAISAFETAAAGPPRRISLATEAFGYVGASLATAGVIAALESMWEELSATVHFVIPLIAAVAVVVAGALVVRNTEPALQRLGTVLWFLAVGATALTLGIFATEIIDLEAQMSGPAVTAVVAGATAAVAAVLWWLQRSGLQVTALFASSITTLGALMAMLPGDEGWKIGLAVWGFGLIWAALGWRNLLTPMPVAVGLGAAAVLIGPALGIYSAGWLFVPALGTAAAAMAVSIPTRQVPLLAAGTTGLFIYLTWVVVDYFGDSLGVPVALGVCGLLFIGLAVAAGRLRRMTLPPGSAGGRPTPSAS